MMLKSRTNLCLYFSLVPLALFKQHSCFLTMPFSIVNRGCSYECHSVEMYSGDEWEYDVEDMQTPPTELNQVGNPLTFPN